MKTRIGALVVAAALGTWVLLMAAALPFPEALAAEISGLCAGRTDPQLVVTAHANGRPNVVPKYILNVWTDASGKPMGSLVLEKGAERLHVTDWCRVWEHVPGQPPGGDCEMTYPEGAITAHAVGEGKFRDGRRVLVRTDVRKTSEGMYFRVRYRSLGGHETASTSVHDGCEDDGWAKVPAEGWYPLDQMRAR